MGKIKEIKTEEVKQAEVFVEKEKPKLVRLDLEFGREDLNRLRDKLNEVIDNQ